jgi:hypothetical protein
MEKKQPIKTSPELKAKVALAAVSGQMTVQEIIKKYGVSKTAVYTWKKELEERAANLFGGNNQSTAQDSQEQTQKRIDNLHRKIGELEMELDFAKRASEALGIGMPAKD